MTLSATNKKTTPADIYNNLNTSQYTIKDVEKLSSITANIDEVSNVVTSLFNKIDELKKLKKEQKDNESKYEFSIVIKRFKNFLSDYLVHKNSCLYPPLTKTLLSDFLTRLIKTQKFVIPIIFRATMARFSNSVYKHQRLSDISKDLNIYINYLLANRHHIPPTELQTELSKYIILLRPLNSQSRKIKYIQNIHDKLQTLKTAIRGENVNNNVQNQQLVSQESYTEEEVPQESYTEKDPPREFTYADFIQARLQLQQQATGSYLKSNNRLGIKQAPKEPPLPPLSHIVGNPFSPPPPQKRKIIETNNFDEEVKWQPSPGTVWGQNVSRSSSPVISETISLYQPWEYSSPLPTQWGDKTPPACNTPPPIRLWNESPPPFTHGTWGTDFLFSNTDSDSITTNSEPNTPEKNTQDLSSSIWSTGLKSSQGSTDGENHILPSFGNLFDNL